MFRSIALTAALLAATPALAQSTAPKAAAPKPAAPQSMPRATLLANAEAEFARVDTNKDGQMSRAEIETFQRARIVALSSARSKAVFNALDSDKNGALSPAEFAKLTPPPKADASAVLEIDTNKDGQVSLAEHRTATLATFDQIDANKDGIMTEAEVQAAAKLLKK